MFCTVTHRLEINTCQEYEYGDATMTARCLILSNIQPNRLICLVHYTQYSRSLQNLLTFNLRQPRLHNGDQ